MFQQSFEANEQGRDFVIGDLHGMYDLLFETLVEVDFDFSRDRCFSCGDLIDRGPDSEQCISLIHEPWFHPVRGNHEDTLIEVARNPSSAVLADWVLNGGRWHLMVSSEKMFGYAEQLDRLPFLIDVRLTNGQHIAICHAEFPLNEWHPDKVANAPDLIRAIQWSRDKVLSEDASEVNGIDHIICGHTIVDEPLMLGNTHFIDTGAFKTHRLTLLSLDKLQ